MRLNATVYRR